MCPELYQLRDENGEISSFFFVQPRHFLKELKEIGHIQRFQESELKDERPSFISLSGFSSNA